VLAVSQTDSASRADVGIYRRGRDPAPSWLQSESDIEPGDARRLTSEVCPVLQIAPHLVNRLVVVGRSTSMRADSQAKYGAER
jgi:hypothetical protein